MKVLLDHNSHVFLLTHEGRKFVHGVALDKVVRKVKVQMDDLRYYRQAQYHGKPYPVGRAKSHLRRIGKTLGITRGAIKELRS